MMSKAKQYAALTRQQEQIRTQINTLRDRLDALQLEKIDLERELVIQVEDGRDYTAPGKPKVTVKREGDRWAVYQFGKLQQWFSTRESCGRALAIWGVV